MKKVIAVNPEPNLLFVVYENENGFHMTIVGRDGSWVPGRVPDPLPGTAVEQCRAAGVEVEVPFIPGEGPFHEFAAIVWDAYLRAGKRKEEK